MKVLNTFVTATLLLALAISAVSAIPSSAVPEDCNGCDKVNGTQPSEVGVISPTCSVHMWRETSNFGEDCGDSGVACANAKCHYDWKVMYKTTGTNCSGLVLYYFVDHYLAEDSSYGPSATSVELDAGTWGPKLCGRTAPFLYEFFDNDQGSGTSIVGLIGSDGCLECSPQ